MNFTLSGAISIVGLLTLRKVSTPNEVIFASLPLLFALHQFTQGFVWLGLNHLISHRALTMASSIFVFYAQGLLPFLIPLAVWLIEPAGWKKNVVAVLMVLGSLLTAYSLWGLATEPTTVHIVGGTLSYINPWTDNQYDATVYILTTCGSLILCSSISVQLFGWLNFIGLALIAVYKPYGFTSLWCLYAAMVSVLLYFYFIERRIRFLQEIKEKEYGLSEELEKELKVMEKKYPKITSKIFPFVTPGSNR